MYNISYLTKVAAINSKTNKTEIYNLNNMYTIIEMAAYNHDNQLSNLTFKTILEYPDVAENTELTAVDDAEIKATIKLINKTYESLVNYDREVQIDKCYEDSFYCYLHDIIMDHIYINSIFETVEDITKEDLIKLEDPLLKLYDDNITKINITADSTETEINEVLTDLDKKYYIEDPSELLNICIEDNWIYDYDCIFYIIDLLNIDFTVADFIKYCEEETTQNKILYFFMCCRIS